MYCVLVESKESLPVTTCQKIIVENEQFIQ